MFMNAADRRLLQDEYRVELLQEAVLDTLRYHCAYRCGSSSCRSKPGAGRLLIGRTLNTLVQLRSVASLCLVTLSQLALDCIDDGNESRHSLLRCSLMDSETS